MGLGLALGEEVIGEGRGSDEWDLPDEDSTCLEGGMEDWRSHVLRLVCHRQSS